MALNKTYQCMICEKSFCQSGTLNRHMRIHKGESFFDCLLCGSRFNRNDNLIRHMRFSHNIEGTLKDNNL